MLDNFMEK